MLGQAFSRFLVLSSHKNLLGLYRILTPLHYYQTHRCNEAAHPYCEWFGPENLFLLYRHYVFYNDTYKYIVEVQIKWPYMSMFKVWTYIDI